ncbi:hypothetical protein MMC09_002987 [Bachmanniomyces sp. S44760]|nr:hypothetical protein [Bachmanniomyces sp. S44760]
MTPKRSVIPSVLAQPVGKDGFFYDGQLIVEVSDASRHPRASLNELSQLLHPVKGARADRVNQWYEAQLLHYGLPPSKNRAVARARLLDALDSDQLNVPTKIKKLEFELRKEFDLAQEKARAEILSQVGKTESSSNRVKNENTVDRPVNPRVDVDKSYGITARLQPSNRLGPVDALGRPLMERNPLPESTPTAEQGNGQASRVDPSTTK